MRSTALVRPPHRPRKSTTPLNNSLPYKCYVSCLSGNEVNVFAGCAISGSLEQIQVISAEEKGKGWVGRGMSLTRSKYGSRIHVSVIGMKDGEEQDRIDTYAVDPTTGRLTFLSGTPVMAQLNHVSVDRTGEFLMGASVPSSVIVVHPIGPRGQVQETPSDVVANASGAHLILTDPSNRFAYAPSLVSHLLYAFKYDENCGTLSPNTPDAIHQSPGAGSRHIAFHPNRRYLYLLNERDGSLIAYRLNPVDGSLHEIMRDWHIRPDLEGEPWGAAVHVSPNGDRLFATERRGNTLAAWDINPESGHVSNRKLVDTANNPRDFDVTPNGRFLVVAALKDDCLEVFDVSDPSEPPKKISELSTGSEPGWVEIV